MRKPDKLGVNQETILYLVITYPVAAFAIAVLCIGFIGQWDFAIGLGFCMFFGMYGRIIEEMAKQNSQRRNNPNQPPSGSS